MFWQRNTACASFAKTLWDRVFYHLILPKHSSKHLSTIGCYNQITKLKEGDKNNVQMSRCKRKNAEAVVEGYKRIEEGVLIGYKKIEQGDVDGFKKGIGETLTGI